MKPTAHETLLLKQKIRAFTSASTPEARATFIREVLIHHHSLVVRGNDPLSLIVDFVRGLKKAEREAAEKFLLTVSGLQVVDGAKRPYKVAEPRNMEYARYWEENQRREAAAAKAAAKAEKAAKAAAKKETERLARLAAAEAEKTRLAALTEVEKLKEKLAAAEAAEAAEASKPAPAPAPTPTPTPTPTPVTVVGLKPFDTETFVPAEYTTESLLALQQAIEAELLSRVVAQDQREAA